MRFFARIKYNGADYCGWQRQPKQASVQATIEDTLSKVLRNKINIVGCGRTDTGVHASEYYFHFDHSESLGSEFARKITGILPNSIVINDIIPVHDDAHARFDASSRSYTYFITGERDPFRIETAYHFPFFSQLDFELMLESITLLKAYDSFFPFCKTHSDVITYKCAITHCEWIQEGQEMTFRISANRFLRGMIRLIVGMSLNVGMRKVSLDEVKFALDNQTRLIRALSVSPSGLFLSKIEYPFIKA